MPLTTVQRRELERIGTEAVTLKCMHFSDWDRKTISGFTCGIIARSDVEQWLVEKWRFLERRRARIRLWGGIAALTAAALIFLVCVPVFRSATSNAAACIDPSRVASATVWLDGARC